jgi:hypothetical protein
MAISWFCDFMLVLNVRVLLRDQPIMDESTLNNPD